MQVNIKRVLSFLVVLAMVLSMAPVTGIPAIEAKAETAATTTTPSYADDLVFQEGGKTAFCPKCNKPVEWTEYTGQYATTVRSDTSAVVTDHFYLDKDLEFDTKLALQTYENTHFHLNGHNITPKPLANESDGYQRVFHCTQEFDLMGTGVVYGGNKAEYNNSGMIMVVSHTLRVHSGTLQHAEGFTPGSAHNLLQIGAGAGKIVIEGGTLNVPAGKLAIYAMGQSATSDNVAVVEISGGTVNGNVQIGSESYNTARLNDASLTFTGGAVNGTIFSDCQAPITIGGTASAGGIDIPADSELTVKEGWSGSAKVAFAAALTEGKVPAANGAAEGDFTGNLVNNKVKLVNNGGVLTQSDAAFSFNDKAPLNYCEHCDKVVAWTALKNGENTDGTANHYYVAADMTAGKGNLIHGAKYPSTNVCLQLNGKTLTTGATDTSSNYRPSIYGSNQAVINIMGEGTVINGGTDKLFVTETCSLNLYGGTYVSSATPAASIQNNNSNVKLFNDAKIVGKTTISAGALTLNDNATIEGLDKTGGTVTTAADWTGYLKNAAGQYLELDANGELTAVTKDPEKGKFDPAACGGYAYCEVCGGDPVLWTAKKGADRIEYVGSASKPSHYYLTGDLNEPITTGQVAGVESGFKLCVNLNGHNITAPGQVYVGSGTISFFGKGNFTFTGDTTATHNPQGDIYRKAGFNFASSTGVLNLFGGTYSVAGQAAEDGKPMVLGNGTLNIKNATVNGTIKNSKVKLEGSAIAEDINIVDGGKVTIAKGWSGTANLTVADSAFEGGILAASAYTIEDAFSGKLTCNGQELTYENGVLMTDTTFNPDAPTNYCSVCGKFVEWTAISGDNKIGVVQTSAEKDVPGEHKHYFLSGDVNYTGTDPFVKVTRAASTNQNASSVCLNLNGYNLTTKGRIEVGSGCDLAIFGEGSTITYTGTSTWVWGTCSLRLFGGTYKGVIAQTEGGEPKLYLKDGVSVTGNLNLYSGTLWLYDTSIIKNVTLASSADYNNHKIILDSYWTGNLALDATIDLEEDGKVPTNRVTVNGGELNGKVVDPYAFAYTCDNGQLVLNSKLDPNVFAPWDSEEGYAYCSCVLCRTQKPVQWVDFNDFVAKNGNNLYVDGDTPTYHFYLSDDLTYNDHVLHTYENIVLNLNGHDISPVPKEDATEITATYAFSCTQKLILMNTSPDMSTVTGWSSEAGEATVIWMNGGASGGTYLMDNVTLTTHEDCTTDAPVARIAGNGAKFYMEGGVIDVSNKENINYPTAVYLEGKTTVNAEFHMNGGEIKGGTSVNAGGAVQVGSRATGVDYLDGACFYMNGGKISGGISGNGGNIYANKNAAEISITGGTITGGTAKNGGNIYAINCNLTIGGTAVISDGIAQEDTYGGGGNIFFGQGTMTVSGGTITNGKVYNVKGNGGNIYLNKRANEKGQESGEGVVETRFIMTDGVISNGYVHDNNDTQNYGGNLRAHNVSTVSITGGEITGGQCAEVRDHSYNMYISFTDAHVNGEWDAKVTFGGDAYIDGGVSVNNAGEFVLTGNVKIAGGEKGLTYNNDEVYADISGLTEGAQIELSEMVHNVPMTKEDRLTPDLAKYITVIDSNATLTVEEGQLILIGVAIVNGEDATWYADNAAAVAAYIADTTSYATGKYIQLGLDTNLVLIGGEYLIDLAGYIPGIVNITGEGVVHLFDSANTDFDGFRTVTVTGDLTVVRDNNVVVNDEAVRFITVTADGKTSAHRLDMAVNGVTLNTEKAGLYYNAEYKCDEYLAKMISAYGVILSVKDMPGTVLDSTDQRTVLTNFAPVNNTVTSTSSSVVHIFKDGRTPELNAELGKMKIYANAYIELNLDGNGTKILVADNENVGQKAGNAWSLYDVLFEIDQNWDDNAAIQGAAKDFFDAWFDRATTLYAEDFQNLNVKVDVEGGEGKGVTPEDTDIDNPM